MREMGGGQRLHRDRSTSSTTPTRRASLPKAPTPSSSPFAARSRIVRWTGSSTSAPLAAPWDNNVGTVHDGFYSAASQSMGRDARQRRDPSAAAAESGQQDDLDHRAQPRGALAELCAAQALFVSKIPVQGVYTFGQPRVGNKDFADAVNAKLGSGIFRFVNDRDIVPRVPLFTMGFCHYGGQRSFDHAGKASVAESAVETLNGALTLCQGRVQPPRPWTGGWPR